MYKTCFKQKSRTRLAFGRIPTRLKLELPLLRLRVTQNSLQLLFFFFFSLLLALFFDSLPKVF